MFGLDETGLEMAEMSLRAAGRMARQVEDLLVASGISDTMPMDRSSIDLARVVRQTMEGVDSERLRYELEAPESLLALGNEERLRVIINHLVSNAEKFAPVQTVVRVKVARTGGGAEMLVSDQGPGIPQAQWEKIFERFVQLDGGSRRRHGGVGLDLFIARQLAQSIGGALEVVKSSQTGTTFRLRLEDSEAIPLPIPTEGGGLKRNT